MRARTLIGLALALVLTCGNVAQADPPTLPGFDYSFEHGGTTYNWDYGYDSSKYINGVTGYSRYAMEIARDPIIVTDGPYATPCDPAYEYLFDLYLFDYFGGTAQSYEFGGFDNSKIRNLEYLMPDGTTYETTSGGTTYQHGRVPNWDETNKDKALVQARWGPSYRSFLTVPPFTESWSTVDLTYDWATDSNPHSHSDYVATNANGWMSFAVSQGESFTWGYTTVTNAVADQIVVTKWNTGFGFSADGLLFTTRVLYDEPMTQEDLWWSFTSYGAGTTYAILGNFTLPGDFDADGDIDADDIDLMGDYIRLGVRPVGAHVGTEFDLSADGTTAGTDGNIDALDLDYLIRSLVETSMGCLGSEYGDFNLDGLIDTTDLTRLATNFGPGTKWAEGNANRNIDMTIDTTDLTILGTYFGFDASVDVIPEPMTLFVMGCGAIGLLRRRRSKIRRGGRA